MKDFRQYQVLIECVASNGCVSKVWVRNIGHAAFINGIQNGGLQYFGSGRQKILNFIPEIQISDATITCDGKFGCE